MNTLKRLEIINFENHEHTIIDDLHKGFNLIFGDGDSGKTSIVRAIKLVAYNEFDPKSVRVGCKNCQVRVDTDRGYVKVTRGKVNDWETCLNGESPQHFSKIGKNILPQASEILGLNMIELGDISLPINIMDQAESHFMLNELGGNDSTGSIRAQIIDEISGLLGIEGVIKNVSLDRHRLGREVKKNEEQAQQCRDKMYDKNELEQEEKLVSQCEKLKEFYNERQNIMNEMADLLQNYVDEENNLSELQKEKSRLPNTKALDTILKRCNNALDKANQLQTLYKNYVVANNSLEQCQSDFQNIPDLKQAESLIETAEKSKKQLNDLSNLHSSIKTEESNLQELQNELEEAEKEENVAICERDDIIKSIELCPLTLKPISDKCFEGINLRGD